MDHINEPQQQVGEVRLPMTAGQFRTFISDLLGQPEILTVTVPGSFVIGSIELSRLHNVLIQRMLQQHSAPLISFESRTDYSDNTSIHHNSFDAFFLARQSRLDQGFLE